MKPPSKPALALLLALALLPAAAAAQARPPHVVPVPPLQHQAPVPEPTSPPAQEISLPLAHLTLHLPPGWQTARHDGELSTFALDARSAARRSRLLLAAALAFNPYPATTFAGALVYVSSSPTASASACALQTTLPPAHPLAPATIDGRPFARARDEHGHICTESRDLSHVALEHGACLRFDLVINTFCGGDVSGAQDLTPAQLASLYSRLEGVLATVHFKP